MASLLSQTATVAVIVVAFLLLDGPDPSLVFLLPKELIDVVVMAVLAVVPDRPLVPFPDKSTVVIVAEPAFDPFVLDPNEIPLLVLDPPQFPLPKEPIH